MHREQGAIFTLAVVIAVLGAIASMTVLQLAYYQSRHARFHNLHTVAQYAAEAGLVWAQQHLEQDPTYCGVPDPPPGMFNPPTKVEVTVSGPCPGPDHTISAKVTY